MPAGAWAPSASATGSARTSPMAVPVNSGGVAVMTVKKAGAGSLCPRPRSPLLALVERGPVPPVERVHDDGRVVHLVGGEHRDQLVAEGGDVCLLRQILVELGPIAGDGVELRRGRRVELR